MSASLPSPAANPAEAEPRPALDDVGNGDDHDDDDQPPPKQFEPLFTLLTNTTTNSTVHPRVHYLFSDDDAASVLAAQDPSSSPSARSLIVDLAPSAAGGWAVSWASSLTPDFAVTGTQVEVSGGDGGALMLRVDGVEREPVEPNTAAAAGAAGLRGSGSGSGVQATREDVDALLEDFRRRMGVLNKVVGQGEKRRAAVGKERAGHDEERDENEDESGREGGESEVSERK